MFCPGCGSEQNGQYCRSCGIDLRVVRTTLERPDVPLNPTSSARDEIGRAIAEKIRELKTAEELSKVVRDVLPGVAAFLETPEERRLRRIRTGAIVASIGLGAALTFLILAISIGKPAPLFFVGLGLAAFLIGLGLVFSGRYFTIPNKREISEPPVQNTMESLPNPKPQPTVIYSGSVSEHTTHELQESKTGESLW
jgi:hypothetical protein